MSQDRLIKLSCEKCKNVNPDVPKAVGTPTESVGATGF